VTPRLAAVRLPIPWDEFGFPNPLQMDVTVLATGPVAWAWTREAPDLGVAACAEVAGSPAGGWGLDHVVVLVPDLAAAVERLAAIGAPPRLTMEVRGRPTAFCRVGPLLEVIESPVRAAAIYGVALVTDEPLEVVVLRWRAAGRDVTDPRPALQPGRRIFTVRALEAGLAVMSPDRAVASGVTDSGEPA
jgi:hypothetical protein